jgi:hypothetical protein
LSDAVRELAILIVRHAEPDFAADKVAPLQAVS